MSKENKYPQLIKGGVHISHRVQLLYVNGMKIDFIEWLNIISNSPKKPLIVWQCDKVDN